MRKLLYSFAVLPLAFLTACGSNGTVNVTELNAIRNIIGVIDPKIAQSAAGLDLSNLSSLLSNASKNSSLTSSQSAALADPSNQAIVQNLLQLVKGGSASVQKTAASNLLAAAGGSKVTLATKLGGIMSLFQEIGPVVAGLDPAISPFIDVVLTILPLVEQVFGGGSSAVVAH
jgi:hypothetical protein